MAASGFRAVGSELESNAEKKDQEINDIGKWETQGKKGAGFPSLKKTCFAKFIFSPSLISLRIFSQTTWAEQKVLLYLHLFTRLNEQASKQKTKKPF